MYKNAMFIHLQSFVAFAEQSQAVLVVQVTTLVPLILSIVPQMVDMLLFQAVETFI